MKPEQRLARIREIIESADARCSAYDGAVGRIQEELSDQEWREIYMLTNVKKPRKPHEARRVAPKKSGTSH